MENSRGIFGPFPYSLYSHPFTSCFRRINNLDREVCCNYYNASLSYTPRPATTIWDNSFIHQSPSFSGLLYRSKNPPRMATVSVVFLAAGSNAVQCLIFVLDSPMDCFLIMCILIADHVNNLQLRNFANASRQLGSSVGLLSSSFQLRNRIASVLFLFRENAADLFPRKVSRQAKEAIVNPNNSKRRRVKHRALPHIARPVVPEIDAEDFPDQLAGFSRDVTNFLKSLNEFPEFTDESLNISISLFEGDLKVGFQN